MRLFLLHLYTQKLKTTKQRERSVTVFSHAAVSEDVVGLRAFTLDTGTIHGSDAAQLVVRVAPTAQTRLETVFELLADEIEDNGVDAGVNCSQVDAKVIQDQKETEQLTTSLVTLIVTRLLQESTEMEREPAESKYEDETEDGFGHLSSLFEVFTEGYPKAAVPVVEHFAGHQSVEDSSADQGYTEIEAEQPPVLCSHIEPCEGSRGVKYAGAQGFVPVVEADHVECDSLRYRQDERQNPNRNNDKDCDQRNADTLHSAPRGHSSVPVDAQGAQVEDCDAHRGFLQEWNHLTQTKSKRTVCKWITRHQQLVYIEGSISGYVDQVPQGQTGDEGVRPVPHALVLVYNPQQGDVANQANYKHYNGNYGVDVLEITLDSSFSNAWWHWLYHNGGICRP